MPTYHARPCEFYVSYILAYVEQIDAIEEAGLGCNEEIVYTFGEVLHIYILLYE